MASRLYRITGPPVSAEAESSAISMNHNTHRDLSDVIRVATPRTGRQVDSDIALPRLVYAWGGRSD